MIEVTDEVDVMNKPILTIVLLLAGLLLIAGCAGNGGTAAPANNGTSPAAQPNAAGNGGTAPAGNGGAAPAGNGAPAVQPNASGNNAKPAAGGSDAQWNNPFFTDIPAPSNAIPQTATVGADGVQTITMTAENFVFSPNTITVKKGVPVRILATSKDVGHSLAIPGLQINTNMPVGQQVEVDFTPNQTGTFPFRCAVFCGSGHRGMTGTIVVTD